jgi:hypothetical protein
MSADLVRGMEGDLRVLAECLDRAGLDAGMLYGRSPQPSAKEADQHVMTFEYCWTSKEADVPDQVRPRDAYGLEVKVTFKAAFVAAEVDSSSDPFRDLCVDITLRSLAEDESSYHYAWHIDRHIEPSPSEAGARNGARPRDQEPLHPWYHIQAGGDRLREHLDPYDNPGEVCSVVQGTCAAAGPLASGRPYGRVLLIDAPRIPVPPMDPVLALDFAFSNFDGKSWRALRREREYRRVVFRSQQRYWRHYYASLHRHFSGEEEGLDPVVLHPGLIRPGDCE